MSRPITQRKVTFTNQRRRRRPRWGAIFTLVILIAFAIGGAWAYRVLAALGGREGGVVAGFKGLVNPRGEFPGKDRIIILVVGKDYNHDRKGMPYTKDARSDTIMLLSVDLVNAKLAAVAVPRDTKVNAPDGVTGKINGTFQRGGIDLLRQTLSYEFGIEFDYYVMLKPDAVRSVVDSVGGVEVEPIDDMFYEDSWAGLKIDLKKGRQRVDGKGAEGFVRFRKTGTHRITEGGRKERVRKPSSLEEGDIRRTERQQQLVQALMREALKPGNIIKAPDIIDNGFEQVETDLQRPQILALATIFKDSDKSGMTGATIPGQDSLEGDAYYWIPDRERTILTLDWILHDRPESGRRLTRVAVYNAARNRSVAASQVDIIEASGFAAFYAGSSKEKATATEVIYRKASFEPFAREIANLLGVSKITKDTTNPNAYWLPEIRVNVAPDIKPIPQPEVE